MDLLKADYLPWKGSTADHLYRGHRSRRYVDSQVEHENDNDNSMSVEHSESSQSSNDDRGQQCLELGSRNVTLFRHGSRRRFLQKTL